MTNFSSDTPSAAGVIRIQTTYLHETFRALCRLNELLHNIREASQDRDLLAELLAVAERIRDLAMIHGFDGVEKITATIASSLKEVFHSNSALDAAMIQRIESAALAIKDVAETEAALEKHMTVERIGGAVEICRRKVRDCATQLSRDGDASAALPIKVVREKEAGSREAESVEDPAAPMFDISEFDFVLQIVDETGETSRSPDLPDSETQP